MKLSNVDAVYSASQKLKEIRRKQDKWGRLLEQCKEKYSVGVQVHARLDTGNIVHTLYCGEELAEGKGIVTLIAERLKVEEKELIAELRALGVDV